LSVVGFADSKSDFLCKANQRSELTEPRYPMNVSEFVSKWQEVELTERSASQQHFLDLCEVFDHPKPAMDDPSGERFTFEKGAAKHGGGQGWADVWKKGFFGCARSYALPYGRASALFPRFTPLSTERPRLESAVCIKMHANDWQDFPGIEPAECEISPHPELAVAPDDCLWSDGGSDAQSWRHHTKPFKSCRRK